MCPQAARPFVDMPGEEWRPVVGHHGYDVSNMGRVRSWHAGGRSLQRAMVPHLRKIQTSKRDAYRTLLFMVERKAVLRYVHHLVLEAFVGPRPEGQLTRHLDRDVGNNKLDNLAWGTHEENCADAVRHGTDTRGERNGGAKLTQAQADEIRASTEEGQLLAVLYGVSAATVSRIKNGHRYAA